VVDIRRLACCRSFAGVFIEVGALGATEGPVVGVGQRLLGRRWIRVAGWANTIGVATGYRSLALPGGRIPKWGLRPSFLVLTIEAVIVVAANAAKNQD